MGVPIRIPHDWSDMRVWLSSCPDDKGIPKRYRNRENGFPDGSPDNCLTPRKFAAMGFAIDTVNQMLFTEHSLPRIVFSEVLNVSAIVEIQ
jgi:hypothetical protein